MTVYAVTTFGLGVHYALEIDPDLVIPAGVEVTSTNDDAIRSIAGGRSVTVLGRVTGHDEGIQLGNDPSADTLNLVHVEDNGRVHGEGIGVALLSSGSSLRNDGVISGGVAGVLIGGDAEGSTSAVVNRGVITALTYGVIANGEATESVSLINFATITAIAENGVAYAYSGADGRDSIANAGLMQGDIVLGAGDDVYDGRNGTLVGSTVYGGNDDDLVRPGAGAETFRGGSGIDTLDFLGSAGLRVSLVAPSGTGRAQGDMYSSFERVLGSRGGDDAIFGNGSRNSLVGFGGRDVLSGAGGADFLVGGDGADRLTGGVGNDMFVFQARQQGGDTITDFRNVSGNNDRFQIHASAFGGGLVAGALVTGAQFDAQRSNAAQTNSVRFIWETDVEKLWFDRNGKGSGGLTLLADLQDGSNVAAADIFLV